MNFNPKVHGQPFHWLHANYIPKIGYHHFGWNLYPFLKGWVPIVGFTN
jgi:hypothetical protein